MARTRLIKPQIAKNVALAKLGRDAQFLFSVLPTHADKEGRLRDRPEYLRAEIFPYDTEIDVDALLDALSQPDDDGEPFIIRYEVDGRRYLQITKFDAHQSPHYKEEESVIPCPPKTCQTQHNVNPTLDQHQADVDPTSLQVTSNKQQETGNKEGGSAEGGNKPSSPKQSYFDQWWQEVHHSVGKKAARDAYDKAVKRIREECPDKNPHAYLLDRMRLFARSDQAKPVDRTPIHPTTWLNQGRYDDDPATWKDSRKPANHHDPRGNYQAALDYLNE